MSNYLQKYNKYKSKYIALKKNIYGGTINKEYLNNIIVEDNIIGYGAYGDVYKDDVKKQALKVYKKKQSVKRIRHYSQIINTMSDNNIGPKYYGTILFKGEKIDEIIELTPSGVLKKVPEGVLENVPEVVLGNVPESEEYNYIVITDLYKCDLKQFLIDTSILSPNYESVLQNILEQISTLILRSLDFYVCSDIKFENMLIKGNDNDYTVVLTDFDGGYCKTINNTEYNETDNQMILHFILLLLLMRSCPIVTNNIEKYRYNYVYIFDLNNREKLSILFPFYYDKLKEFFNKNKEDVWSFLDNKLFNDRTNYDNNKLNNIIVEILRLIHYLKIREHVGFNFLCEFNHSVVMMKFMEHIDEIINVIKKLINFLFEIKDLKGGEITLINKSINYDNHNPIGSGSFSKIYDIDGKIHKISKNSIKNSDLMQELSIYKEYDEKEIGIHVYEYFFEGTDDKEGNYGYLMDKYNCDLEEFFINYIIDEKSSYENKIKTLIDRMFETSYICGDIKFNNMLIKDGKIILTDFDYKFCFKKTEDEYEIYKTFIYFSLVCSLHNINVKRLLKLLDLNSELFKSGRFSQYLRLFDDQTESIYNMVINKLYLPIKKNQPFFFFSQFHYIFHLFYNYIMYSDHTTNLTKERIDYIKKNENPQSEEFVTEYEIDIIFKFIFHKLLRYIQSL
jgi:hypothetical protein